MQFAHWKKVFTSIHSPTVGPCPHGDLHIASTGGVMVRTARTIATGMFSACLLSGTARYKKTFEKHFHVVQSGHILHIEQICIHRLLRCEALRAHTFMATMTSMEMEEKMRTAWMLMNQKRIVFRAHLRARLLRRHPSILHCTRHPHRLGALPLGDTRVSVIRLTPAAEQARASILWRSSYRTQISILREHALILMAGGYTLPRRTVFQNGRSEVRTGGGGAAMHGHENAPSW